jgi:uncharacterized membrane protein YedE/YeeE
MEQAWINAILGGLLIGLSASILLITYGRVLGVSGITGRISEFNKHDTAWRFLFVLGIIAGGYIASKIWPENFVNLRDGSANYLRMAIAGFIVGYGTKMGRGCTSGHGVCGVGRLSPRSIIATLIFITFGVATVAILGR